LPGRRRRTQTALLVGLLAAVLAFVGVIQIRSQAEVERSLAGEDEASLAFQIDDLHRANESLSAEAAALSARRDALRSGTTSAASTQLAQEVERLRVVEGLIAVRGPGVVLMVDAPLRALDLQDAINNLLLGGAEAISVNDRRVTLGTAVRGPGGTLTIDGTPVHAPWTFAAVGDPDRLQRAAERMTRSLRTDPRVHDASYRVEADLVIRPVLSLRPFVYASP